MDYESKYTGEEVEAKLDALVDKRVAGETTYIRIDAFEGEADGLLYGLPGSDMYGDADAYLLSNISVKTVEDLENYYTKTEVDNAIKSAITTTLNTSV